MTQHLENLGGDADFEIEGADEDEMDGADDDLQDMDEYIQSNLVQGDGPHGAY